MHEAKLLLRTSTESLVFTRSQWTRELLSNYQNAECLMDYNSVQGEAEIFRLSVESLCSQLTFCILMVEKLGMASLGASAFRVHHISAKSSPYHNTTYSIPLEHLADSFNRFNSQFTRVSAVIVQATPRLVRIFYWYRIFKLLTISSR